MTTVSQEYMTSEEKKITPSSKFKDNIISQEFIITESFSVNDKASNPETHLKDYFSEDSGADSENDGIQRDIKNIENPDNFDEKLDNSNQLLLFLKSQFTSLLNFFHIIYNMINSDINSIFDICFTFLGISQRINKKFLKQLFVIAVIVVSFVRSRNEGVYQSFETHRLFSRYSLVTDFFHGELSLLNEELQESDLTVVMYYAPWDRQSQNFASHFSKAAQFHHEQVSFAAINCWLPKSECSANYKLNYYPVIVLHVKVTAFDESLTVPYNGPLSANHLIRFISKALRPFTHITSQAELLAIQLENQVIALGYYDVGNFNKDFVSFYYAAISKLQFEHMSDVRYCLITNPDLARKVSFAFRPSILLITWNTTLVFPPRAEKNIRNITTFVDLHLSEVVHWLHVSGRKSLALNSVFQEGPFMVVFAPDNPYYSMNSAFQLLRSVALEYYNCNQSPAQTWLAEHFHLKPRTELKDLDSVCRDYVKKHLDDSSNRLVSLQSDEKLNEFARSGNSLDVCEIEEPPLFRHVTWSNWWSYFSNSEAVLNGNFCLKTNSDYSCKNNNESSNEKNSKSNLWEKINSEEHTIKGAISDDRVSKLTDWVSEDHCKRLALGSLVTPPLAINERGDRVRIDGLSCQTNRTLKFIAIDSLLHQDVARHLGINLRDGSPKHAGSVIVDPEKEERYILDQPLSRTSMSSFVYNFTNNILNRGKIFSSPSRTKIKTEPGEISIFELDGNNYMEVVNKPRQAFVVLHYSHHCGACSVLGNVLLTCAHLTTGVSNLTFARIDVSKNTLPWHLTFETVPTIVFYPHDKQFQSRIFNHESHITVKNLLQFIISGLKPWERNSMAAKLCDARCKQAAAAQSLVRRIKLHHDASVTSSRLKRCIAVILSLQDQRRPEGRNSILQSKYDFLLQLKLNLNRKLNVIKSKLSHLNEFKNFFPNVPSEFPNHFVYETKVLLPKGKTEL